MKFLISNMFVLIVIAFLLVTKLLQSQEDIILSGNAILIALPAKKYCVSVPPVAGVSRQSTLKNHYRTIKPENSFLIDPYNPVLLLEVPS